MYKADSENITFKLIKFILMGLEVAGSVQGMAFIWPGLAELLFIPLLLAGKMKRIILRRSKRMELRMMDR